MTPSNPLPEADVLVSRDPNDIDSDAWPEFNLNNAIATLPGSDEPVSLLLASEHHPLTVTGRLEPPRKDQERLWRRTDGVKKGTAIVVEDVRSFAYGAYEDGSIDLWASGKAGWFILRPARAYRPIHHHMCEAVRMLFFVADAYSQPAVNIKGKCAQSPPILQSHDLFEKYAREKLGGVENYNEASKVMYKHRDFLLSSMIAGKEGIAWARNPFFRHLSRRFPDDLQNIRERLAPPPQEKPAALTARQASLESASTSSTLKRKRGRPPKSKPTDVISIASSSAASSMKKDVPQRSAPKSREMPKPAPPPTRRTRNTSLSITPPDDAEVHESATPAKDSDSDDDDHPRNAGKGKSALRLKPNKPMKGPPRGLSKVGKGPSQDEDEPRSSPIPAKRTRDEPTNIRRSKRRNSRPDLDEGIDMPTSPSSNADADAESGAVDPSHPSLSDALAAHKPDPLQESTRICALDSCTHKIYGDPSNSVSQRLIREHYALHAYDDDERVQLVKRLQAPSMPVSHLMEKVRVAAKVEGFPGSKVAGTRFPEPLKTRY